MAAFDIALNSLTAVITATVQSTARMTKKLAIQITGGLSNPSKMPGSAWGTPAWNCITGSKLAKIPGSVCFNCYAKKRAYTWPNVRAAYERRFDRMMAPRWVEAMVFLIRASKDLFFRWHDSGDLQTVEQLERIVEVCLQLPEVKFWMPSREYKIVMDYLKDGGVIPSNLVIRLSAHMVDSPAPSGYGLPTSTVHTSESKEPTGQICRAYQHDNECGDCRACWNPAIANVSYIETQANGKHGRE